MADDERERTDEMPVATTKRARARHLLVALLAECGEVAPVDIGRFGKHAGQIIARGASTRLAESKAKRTGGRKLARGYGAL